MIDNLIRLSGRIPVRNVAWNGCDYSFEIPYECMTQASMAMVIPARQMNLTGKTINIALNLWALGIALQPVTEFRSEDIQKAFNTSHTTAAKVTDLLEASGLAVIDRQEWSKKMGGAFMWRFKDDFPYNDGPGTMWDSFKYELSGTLFETYLDLYHAGQADIEAIENAVDFGYDDNFPPGYFPDWLYVAPYNRLKYKFFKTGGERSAEFFEFSRNYRNFKKRPVYKSGRLFYVFHWWKKEYRHGFTYNGSPLTELFDLHCSFFTLTAALKKNDLPRKEYEKLIRSCINGKLYDDAARFIGLTRDCAKEQLQAWRNSSRAQAHAHYKAISEFMEREYPAFSRIIYEWPTVIKEGQKRNVSVKTLQVDISEFESRVFSKICRILVDKYKVTPFSLHDAIYISEDDMKKLPENISDILLKWFADNVL